MGIFDEFIDFVVKIVKKEMIFNVFRMLQAEFRSLLCYY